MPAALRSTYRGVPGVFEHVYNETQLESGSREPGMKNPNVGGKRPGSLLNSETEPNCVLIKAVSNITALCQTAVHVKS